MAFIHGKGSVYLLNASDLSAFSNKVEVKPAADKQDVTTFGKGSHVYKAGLGDGTATLSGIYDDGADGPRAVIKPLIGTVVTFVHRPEGTGAGKPQDTVPVLVESYTETVAVADHIMWEAELQFSGDVVTVDQ